MNYLATIYSYLKSVDDWKSTSDLLNHLRYNNIDVAFLTHSDVFLTEASKFCKYVYYNKNNTLVKFKDLLLNVNYLNPDNMFSYGHSWISQPVGWGNFSKNFLETPHTPACLKLLKMGINVAKENNYKWIVIIQSDSIIPKCGYKNLIEEKIKELEEKNKDGFYVYNHISLVAFPFTIINVNSIYNVPELFESKWDIDESSFIKNFGFGFYENILNIICSKYCKNGLVTEHLDLILKKYYFDEKNIDDKTCILEFERYLFIHTVPYKINNKFNIMYFSYSKFNKKLNIKDIKIFKNDDLIFKKDILEIYPECYEAFSFENINFLENDLIKLNYIVFFNNKEYYFEESFLFKNIEQIYNKLLKIEINN